jgi:hypothetical protein
MTAAMARALPAAADKAAEHEDDPERQHDD